ncbi:hypothetical protein G5B40_20170 [Pikeienuella piscinae]|uniref:Uncharacterized protein n=1 Tax=Pikeienuella piscinae TaxID=2748098 RepID=A0A7M3T6C8_9RHOB|nr:hypothetical protein [Pikeienuella piscinae]QIE57559.1 hypothetical protein G5B40_20170 [Pikeienuella piscinae]
MEGLREGFPWPSHYGHYNFFETQMAKHGRVTSLTPQGGGVYELTRTQGDTLRVFICECYAFGVAAYMETVDQLGEVDVVIINSAWCGYTPDAKRYCRDASVGLFKIAGFMAALHRDDYWMLIEDFHQDYFKERGWL